MFDWSPLYLASGEDHMEMVKYLIQNGAQINNKNKTDQTPFLHAARMHHIDVLEFLIQKGAEFDMENGTF